TAAVVKPFATPLYPRGRFLESEPILLSVGAAALRSDRRPTSRAGLLLLLRESFADALAPSPEKAPARLFGSVEAERRRLLGSVAKGERPVLVAARTVEEIDAALALARDFPLRMTLVHADQAAELAPAIARAGASVVLPPLTPYSPRETLRLA